MRPPAQPPLSGSVPVSDSLAAGKVSPMTPKSVGAAPAAAAMRPTGPSSAVSGVSSGSDVERVFVDLSHLTIAEQKQIIAVMQRDEAMRRMEERRILHLKAELQRLRKRGALRPGLDPERTCARCLSTLGRVINRGAVCPICHKKVCKECRLYENGDETSANWMCVLCQKQLELKATSGQWMRELSLRSRRRRSFQGPLPTQVVVSPTLVSQGAQSTPTSPAHQAAPQQGRSSSTPNGSLEVHPCNGGLRVPFPVPQGPRGVGPRPRLHPGQHPRVVGPVGNFPSRSPPPVPLENQPNIHDGVRWAPLKAPLSSPRRLPRQGSSLSSQSSSASATTTPASTTPSTPVPHPRTRRRESSRTGSGDSSPALNAASNVQENSSSRTGKPLLRTPSCLRDAPEGCREDEDAERTESFMFRRVTIKRGESGEVVVGDADSNGDIVFNKPVIVHDENCFFIPLECSVTNASSDFPPIDPFRYLPAHHYRYPDLISSTNMFHRGHPARRSGSADDIRSSTSTLVSSCQDAESCSSASPMIRRLQAQIRARRSFREAIANCHSDSDKEGTLTRDCFPSSEPCPPLISAASTEKILQLPEDYQLVFITSSSDSEWSTDDITKERVRKKRHKKHRTMLRVKSRLEVGKEGASYIEDSDWEFTSDSDYARKVSSLCSLDDAGVLSDAGPDLGADLAEGKSTSLEDLPSFLVRVGSCRKSVRRPTKNGGGVTDTGVANKYGVQRSTAHTSTVATEAAQYCKASFDKRPNSACSYSVTVSNDSAPRSLPNNVNDSICKDNALTSLDLVKSDLRKDVSSTVVNQNTTKDINVSDVDKTSHDDSVAMPMPCEDNCDATVWIGVPENFWMAPKLNAIVGDTTALCDDSVCKQRNNAYAIEERADLPDETMIPSEECSRSVCRDGKNVQHVHEDRYSPSRVANTANADDSSVAPSGTPREKLGSVSVTAVLREGMTALQPGDDDLVFLLPSPPSPAPLPAVVVHRAVYGDDVAAGKMADATGVSTVVAQHNSLDSTCETSLESAISDTQCDGVSVPLDSKDIIPSAVCGEHDTSTCVAKHQDSVAVNSDSEQADSNAVLSERRDREDFPEELQNFVVSRLERYFTEVLDSPGPFIQQQNVSPDSSERSPSPMQEMFPEDDEDSSSDDQLYQVPHMSHHDAREYGNPRSYSLHIIHEESCEESDLGSRPTSPPRRQKRQSSELEMYYSYAIGNAAQEERWSMTSDEASSDVSDREQDNPEMTEEEAVEMASCRLEKYFTSSLIQGVPSSMVSTDEKARKLSTSSSSDGAQSPTSNATNDNATSAFEGDASYDTVKRKKITVTATDNTTDVVKDDVAKPANIDAVETTLVEENKVDIPTVNVDIDNSNESKDTAISKVIEKCESKESLKVEKKSVSPATGGDYSDEEAAYVVNRLVAHIQGMNTTLANSEQLESAWKARLEGQIVQLMQCVSPAVFSESSCSSSTIGSNNSDYGSDTLESEEYTSTDDEEPRGTLKPPHDKPIDAQSGHSTDSTISEETLFICKRLLSSLKLISEKKQMNSELPPNVELSFSKAQEYIQHQIVQLMHTVNASQHNSPAGDRRSLHIFDKKITESNPPSESGSETISTSISIPSYDSDHTATESENSHEMEELYNMLADDVTLSKLSCCDSEDHIDHALFPTRKSHPAESRMFVSNKVEFNEPVCDISATMESISPPAKCDSSSTLTASDLDFAGSVETVLEVKTAATANSPPLSISPEVEISAEDKSRSEPSLYIKAKRGSAQRKAAAVTRSSDSLTPHHKRGIESKIALQLLKSKVTSKSDYSISDVQEESALSPKEKSCSENNLTNIPPSSETSTKVTGTKSAGNITDLESSGTQSSKSLRDTGYYSFKSSEESVGSGEEGARSSPGSLTRQKSQPLSEETIPEEDVPVRPPVRPSRASSQSTSSIPESVFVASRASTLPSNLRNKSQSRPSPQTSSMVLRQRHFSSTFFSTSGVLRKLAALKVTDDGSTSSPNATGNRMSPRSARFRPKPRTSSEETLSLANRNEPINASQRSSASVASSEKSDSTVASSLDNLPRWSTLPYSRSHTSLSSLGIMRNSESMTSVYSAAGGGRYGTVAVSGDVRFYFTYNYKTGHLEVTVKECRNLAAADTKRNRSDPYVKLYLLPDRTRNGKRKTKVKKHTLNPVFDEVLKFRVTLGEVQTRTLWLSVWHSDIFGRNDFLGEIMLPLSYELLEKNAMEWYPLQERVDPYDTPLSYKGDLIVALKYMQPDPAAGPNARGSLHILVKEARNLMATRSNGTSDPFCKSYLLPDRTRVYKQKTSVVKKTCNPRWNHTFVYPDVSLDDLKNRCLELTLWDYDKITSNDFLGGVRLSLGTNKYYEKEVDWMDSQGEEVALWRSMLERPNLWIDGSLMLRPSLQCKR